MDIYSEEIIDHYLHPRKKGTIKKPSAFARMNNPSCGDVIEIRMKIGKGGKIEIARFSGAGCAISCAAASLLMEKIEGKNEKEVMSMNGKDVKKMLGIGISQVREHCAILPLMAAQKAISDRRSKDAKRHEPKESKKDKRGKS